MPPLHTPSPKGAAGANLADADAVAPASAMAVAEIASTGKTNAQSFS